MTSARDGHALLLAAGELVGELIGLAVQSHQLENVGDALFRLARRGAHGAHGKAQIFIDRFLLDQAEILKDHADGPAQQRDLPVGNVVEVEAVDHQSAAARQDLAREELDDGRFAASGGADEKDEFAVVDLHRHTAQRVCPVLIFLLHVGQADHRRVLPFFSKFAYFILLYASGEEMAIKIM